VQNILFVAPDLPDHPPLQVARALVAADYDIAPVTRDAPLETWCEAFTGRFPDLIVADLSDSAELLTLPRIRERMAEIWGEAFPMPPVLALITRKHLWQSELRYFTDDFLMPPYDPEETKARAGALLFHQRHIEPGGTIQVGGMRLSEGSGKAFARSGEELPLTPKEFELLRFLSTHRGRSFTREQLLTLVWGPQYDGGARTVDIHVRRLRAKLPPESATLLETRWGSGYCLKAG
jgi:two-component system, OmpR family, alkaline phosphatase synthesis response regulator PhoP